MKGEGDPKKARFTETMDSCLLCQIWLPATNGNPLKTGGFQKKAGSKKK